MSKAKYIYEVAVRNNETTTSFYYFSSMKAAERFASIQQIGKDSMIKKLPLYTVNDI